MIVLTQRDKAYGRLSRLAKLKVDLDEATTIENKFRAAIVHGYLPLIQHFLQNGLTPETSICRNLSAINLAINYCGQSLDTMHLFLKKGFLINHKDGDSNNSLHWILEKIQAHIYCFLSDLDMKIELFKILLASGCNLEQVNSHGKTPLQLVEENDFLEIENGQKEKILTQLHEAIKEVRAGQFQYTNPLSEIISISPEQLDLSSEEQNDVALFQSKEYEKIGNGKTGFLEFSTTSERYVHTFFSGSPGARERLKNEFDRAQSFFRTK